MQRMEAKLLLHQEASRCQKGHQTKPVAFYMWLRVGILNAVSEITSMAVSTT
jgi:hypothetical protein